MRTSKKITTYTKLNTEVEVEIDVDMDIIEEYIDRSTPEELKSIYNRVTESLSDDYQNGTTLIFHNPNMMQQMAMQELQEVLRYNGPEFIQEAIHQFKRK